MFRKEIEIMTNQELAERVEASAGKWLLEKEVSLAVAYRLKTMSEPLTDEECLETARKHYSSQAMLHNIGVTISGASENDIFIWIRGWEDTFTAAGQSREECHSWLRRRLLDALKRL
jgi:hypothetical protein